MLHPSHTNRTKTPMDWATGQATLFTLLNWTGEDTLPVTLSEIRLASEELLECIGDLQEDIKELTLDLQARNQQLTNAKSMIARLR